MSLANFIEFEVKGDTRGSLISLEGMRNIPFNIKRVYYIFDNSFGVERGFHAHHKLKQIVICMSGECTFILDDGKRREEIILNDKRKGLFIDGFIWREMKNFSPGAVLVVLASEYFDEGDYVRNYEDFKGLAK